MTEQTNNRQSQLGAYVAIATTGAGAIAVAAIANTITGAIDSLPPATTAGIVTSLPVALTAMCGFSSIGAIGAAAFIVAWRTPRPAQRQQRDDEPMLVQSPRHAQLATPTIRQLPAPTMPTEPRYAAFRGDIVSQIQREQQRAHYADDTDNGPENPSIATYSSDYGHVKQQYDDVPQTPTYAPQTPSYEPTAPVNERITARLGDGQEVNISAAAWIAFASLDKPSREQWRQQLQATGNSAPNSDYSQCKQVAESYRLLSGAGAWISPKMRDNVTQWLINP